MRSRRTLLAILGGVAAFAIVIGSAATLGGIDSTSLGADDTLVASCDTDGVTSAYTSAYDATISGGGYEVASVTIGGIDDGCDGQSMSITLVNAAGTSLGQITQSVPVLAATYTNVVSVLTQQTRWPRNVEGIHVVITG